MVIDCGHCPLRKRDVFEPLSDEEVEFMRRFKIGELKVDAGATVLMEGSNSPQLFSVLSGLGLRYKLLPNGRRQVVNFVFPGSFLGLQAGVMGEMKHSVEATSAMVLCVFNRTDLWNFFKLQPTRAYDLTWLAAMEEHFMGEALTSIGQMNAMQRMCWGLMRYATRCSDLGINDRDRYPFPFRQQDLADALGLSLVHTNKTLMKLREQGDLSLGDGVMVLHHPDRMKDRSLLPVGSPNRRPLI
ncbi:Crp/Fnr family transcriptional regulator [Gymnodinialimonas ceratoperidinii]|uniref:Crp/Fnr family transcriptional regulator n=1 Tax=Gymnodinialimonas ceratoperidinii TaxID=2856823 RepID=A0A8F6TUT2_9RHOB|nr:Crp/Fnr family transcriptional regulator [Gymnodinialimonas ceratoperidinii]QXT39110.1 Crp/Fnr family transcriptional regulator [Gymnodinialimonas ceratoperidinii]